MNLPEVFVRNIHAIYGEAGAVWLDTLDGRIAELERAWDMRFVRPMDVLSIHVVGLVELADGTEAVLKMGPPHPQLMTEVQCLRGWTDGVVKVLRVDTERNAFLMERLAPAGLLSGLVREGDDDGATRIIAATLLRLQDSIADGIDASRFPHVSDLFAKLQLLEGHVDPRLLAKAQSLSAELTQPRASDRLLHGDLHHENILRHGDDWVVIDPQGYIGNPVYEVTTMMHNPNDCIDALQPLDRTLDRRFNILAEMLPFDTAEMRAWTFCHCVLSLAWNIDDNQPLSPHVLRIGELLSSLV